MLEGLPTSKHAQKTKRNSLGKHLIDPKERNSQMRQKIDRKIQSLIERRDKLDLQAKKEFELGTTSAIKSKMKELTLSPAKNGSNLGPATKSSNPF